jgi:hypothetical protein
MREISKNGDGDREMWDFEVRFKEFEIYALWWKDDEEGGGVSI